MKRLAAILLTLVLVLASTAYAESIRGPITAIKQVSSRSASFPLRLNQIGVIGLGEEKRFQRGLRVRIDVPEEMASLGGAVALSIYSDISPQPREEVMTLEGELVFSRPLPNARRFFVGVPLTQEHGITEAADTFVVETALSPERFPVAVALLPRMKGLPGDADKAVFDVTVTPIAKEQGAVRLVLVSPEGQPVATGPARKKEFLLSLDGSEIDYTQREFVMEPGLHELELRSETYENRDVTFGIERGKIVTLEVGLERPRSVIRVDAPRGTELFVDGSRVEPTQGKFTLSPGEHSILFKVGDYTISRRLTVKPKKTYKISLALDILVTEE